MFFFFGSGVQFCFDGDPEKGAAARCGKQPKNSRQGFGLRRAKTGKGPISGVPHKVSVKIQPSSGGREINRKGPSYQLPVEPSRCPKKL